MLIHQDTVDDVCMYQVETKKVKEVMCRFLSLLLADNHSVDTNRDENPINCTVVIMEIDF